MSKILPRPAQRRHVLLYDDDWEFLEARFGKGTESTLSVSDVVRRMVSAGVVRLREREVKNAESILEKKESIE